MNHKLKTNHRTVKADETPVELPYNEFNFIQHSNRQFGVKLLIPVNEISESTLDVTQATNNLFIPQRIVLATAAKDTPKADEIIRRVQEYNPHVPIIEVASSLDDPAGMPDDAGSRWRLRQDAIVLAPRSKSFITTFASPGKIVEDLGTILHLGIHCAYNCQYCYLQNVMPPQHIIYTNTERVESDVAVEPFVHRSILTLWSVISFNQKQPLMKIPRNFHYAADYVRTHFQKQSISSDAEAIDLLYELTHSDISGLYKRFLSKPERNGGSLATVGVRKSDLQATKSALRSYYEKNSEFKSRLNLSEFIDFLGIEHLAGNAAMMMQLLHKHGDIELGCRTKSANVDPLLQYDGDNRVRIGMGLNTERVIDEYELGTPSLEERLLAAQKIQAAHGFDLRIIIEPIIKYDNWVDEYRKLISRITSTIDPKRVVEFTFGTVRLSGKLLGLIKRNYPDSDLPLQATSMQKSPGDTKLRYSEEDRQTIYQVMIDEARLKAPGAIYRLGADTSTAWENIGLGNDVHRGRRVYQYSNENFNTFNNKENIL